MILFDYVGLPVSAGNIDNVLPSQSKSVFLLRWIMKLAHAMG